MSLWDSRFVSAVMIISAKCQNVILGEIIFTP